MHCNKTLNAARLNPLLKLSPEFVKVPFTRECNIIPKAVDLQSLPFVEWSALDDAEEPPRPRLPVNDYGREQKVGSQERSWRHELVPDVAKYVQQVETGPRPIRVRMSVG